MHPIVLSAFLGFCFGGGGKPRLGAALGLAGLVAAEDATGLPLSLLGAATAPPAGLGGWGVALARGATATAAYSSLGFWGVVGAALAYELGGAVRGDVR